LNRSEISKPINIRRRKRNREKKIEFSSRRNGVRKRGKEVNPMKHGIVIGVLERVEV